ncbi:Signal transduction histidine kinase [Ruminococcus sp. YE71]|uniref:sensor histidine kinase n=1 Tax=unclassified Ruminococcus TaxID=2608920 RepID=UPI000890E107|nr:MULTISPECIES: HAMP domain-containing sensor histidine kinase [unclassified Ruminococcus]SDA28187.1 Signal transduction histidine kinase [Ruminococcus sp. YE78]SFW34980.1 Signal transduction histidine kinase [Ruminococcus sp. YE71]
MGNLKNSMKSLKMALLKYLPLCLAASLLGISLISKFTSAAAERYRSVHPITAVNVNGSAVTWESTGSPTILFLIEKADYLLIPLWVIFCVAAAGFIFYSRELKEPIGILMKASKKIADNELDFHVQYHKDNELGILCTAFEDMRGKLFDSNLEIWHHIEERRRLSAAFSHDLRTPLTVLSGYVELMQNYGDRLTAEKRDDILNKMQQQVSRLTHYTEKMNAVQKLEDISPMPKEVGLEELCSALGETGRLVAADKEFSISRFGNGAVYTDTELLMQVYENMVSNAVRYAESRIDVTVSTSDYKLCISVCDDGRGFSEEAVEKASKPFFRDEQNSDMHFGLGLYICKILCGKLGGDLIIENGENGGGKVTAEIFLQKLIKS